ncbi:MAG: putative cytosol aminopeptidase [Firmicutes bacterium]|nr:putative cytosol aminopeptidase [candidate division NPL-UPA2 bacterium]
MNVSVRCMVPRDVLVDAIMVGVYEDGQPNSEAASVDLLCGGLLQQLLNTREITGKLNEVTTIYPPSQTVRKVVVVGLGAADKLDVEKLRQAAANGIKAAAKGKIKSIAAHVLGAGASSINLEDAAAALVEGALLATYSYDALKSKQEEKTLSEVILFCASPEALGTIEQGVKRGVVMAEAANLARDLVNAPANHMTPTHMAEKAQQIAKECVLHCEVLERSDMERLGMGALLGVAKGSAEPPKLIVLRYDGNPGGATMAFVGKGLTFDSGGISIKPAENMHLMKDDMAGGAAVLGAMQAVGKLKPKVNILGIVPATENMPAGNALKPGDVITAMTGKTIEIINTDAEGRLILADAVAYAVKLGASKIVDIATLTGACGIALGSVYSAVITNCDQLAQDLQSAASTTGERYWPMPNHDEYREMIKSSVADIKNSGGRMGGVMTGGLFIGEFVGETAWAHLDIAPTAYTESEKHYQPKGATGVATRTLAALALLWGEQNLCP